VKQLDKARMLKTLPVLYGKLCIRAWERDDPTRLAAWPPYPFPHESFVLSYGRMTPAEREGAFLRRDSRPDRITLVADHQQQEVMGYVALIDIDWTALTVGNMSFRVHPFWCSQGVGTDILHTVVTWCIDRGMKSIRLDVAASNGRAIRCYEKCGFFVSGTFWRDDPELSKLDMSTPIYDFLRPHVRVEKGVSQLRFYWMHSSGTCSSESP
jgi:RimJ/RimL family protein N-acetyltransferase